ncbi:MAG: Spy/CpxP family protein refolding chaperone [Paraglaciecola sp.]|jgi:Spy/CpxP family protein refolding chaperone
MLSLKSLIKPLAFSVAIILGGNVYAKSESQPHTRGGLHQILKQLDLNDQQRQDIRQLLKQHKADRSVYRQHPQEKNQALRTLIQSTSWDQDAVMTELENRQATHSEHMWQKVQSQHQIWLTLTPLQQQQFLSLLAQQDDDKRGDRHLHRRLKKLDLTEQQWAQVESNRSKMQTYITEHKAAQQKFRQALTELIGKEELSHNDWLVLQSNYLQDWLAHGMFRAENEHALWVLLAPGQQKKWQLMQQRTEQEMHKHKSKHHSSH